MAVEPPPLFSKGPGGPRGSQKGLRACLNVRDGPTRGTMPLVAAQMIGSKLVHIEGNPSGGYRKTSWGARVWEQGNIRGSGM